MLELRASNEDIVALYAREFESAEFTRDQRLWEVEVDIALPCATKRELDESDAINSGPTHIKIRVPDRS